MILHIKIKTLENNHTHFNYKEGGQNYTLCGLETGGDLTLGIHAPIAVKRKVNCPSCIKMVEVCHLIKKSEYEQL